MLMCRVNAFRGIPAHQYKSHKNHKEGEMSLRIDLSGMSTAAAIRQIDLSSLPAVHHNSGSRFGGIFLILFSLFWGGIPGIIFISMVTSGEYESSMFFLLLFPVIGIGVFLGGLYTFTFRETLRIDATSVSREAKSIFGYKYWTEPLERYPGVLQRTEHRSGGKNSSSYTLHIVELYHEEKKKRIKLYESRSPNGFRKIWEDYSRQLNKPALEGSKGNMVSRAVEDLDKSVRDLAREGKLEVDFDPRKPPPDGFDLRVDGDKLRVSLPRTKSSIIGTLFFMAFAGVFLFIGFGIDDAPIAFGIIGLVFVLLIVAGLAWSRFTRQVLLIGKDRVRIFYETPWGDTTGKMMDASQIETVRIGYERNRNEREGVLLITDNATKKIGEGLPSEAQNWLKNCILAVIAKG